MQNLNDLFKSIFSGIQSSIKRINSKIKKLDTDIKNIDIPTSLPNPNALTFTGAVKESYDGSSPKTVNVPTKLPNPNALTFTGAVRASYNGSNGVSVDIPDVSGKMDRYNPTGTGSFSLNRKAGTVVGANSHAEGKNTTASGSCSHAEGVITNASGEYSHAEGGSTTALGFYSHAEGGSTTASGQYSHAEGSYTTASGEGSHAEGYNTKPSGSCSHAEGSSTTASGFNSHAEGLSTTAASSEQHVQGKYNIEDSSDVYADIIGNGTYQNPSNAATVDWHGNAWYAGDVYVGSTSGTNKDEGSKKLATEDSISGKMDKNNPTGTGSFSLNRKDGTAIGTCSHAEGGETTASGRYSHAEGWATTASGDWSHSEGNSTTASGDWSHSEGQYATASGSYSHAEGQGTASGPAAHAEGSGGTKASGNASHAEGYGTTASSSYQHTQGKYNIEDSSGVYADIIGNGASKTNRSNAATVDWSGNAWYAGDVYVGSTSGTNKDEGSKKLATEEYVDNSVSGIEIPTALPNPKSLTFTGAVNASYNGSSEVSVGIPGALSELSEDATHRIVTDAEKAKWNAKSNFSGSYNDLTDKPTIPDVPVQSVNGKTGAVVLSAEDVGALPGSTVIPTALPNPNALTFTGAATGSYDGSTPVTVEIPVGADGKSAYQYAQESGYTGTETEFAEKLAQKPLIGTTNELTPTQVYEAVSAGIPVKVQYIDETFGVLSYTNFNIAESMNVIGANTISYFNDVYILGELLGNTRNNEWFFMSTILAQKTDIPSKLPNPSALTFTGAVTGSYDGSASLSVKIPSAVTDDHINSLIDTKLGVIENGSY